MKKLKLADIRLWAHQTKALDCISEYLTAYSADPNLGSALINLPTGTGKTGVIACAAHFQKGVGLVLILSPRTALREQIAREVQGIFFEKLGKSGQLPKAVAIIKNGHDDLSKLDLTNTICICTIQMLQTMARENNENYKLLQETVDLVMVDEGHYEPSIAWKEAIRGISKPKILFTATPFRNDLKLFDVNYKHAFSYSFKRAVTDKIIRNVEVIRREAADSPESFVKDVIAFYNSTFPKAGPNIDQPRVIIRCDSDNTIRQIGAALQAANKSFILIHERFKNSDNQRPHERQTVPEVNTEEAIFWVHQFKLLEGIDDSRFQVIALFEELPNTRSLVQQIGRVVRNPAKSSSGIGYFLDHSCGRQASMWEDFIKFDNQLESQGAAAADFGPKIVEAFEQTQPDVVYIDGRFRSKMTLDSINPATDLLIPQTTNVLRKLSNFELEEVCKKLQYEYETADRDVRILTIDKTSRILVYLDFQNSTLLSSKYFIECRLGATIIKQVDDYVFVFDSTGGLPSAVTENCEYVSIKELRKLFPNTNAYLTTVSLHSSDLNHRALRTRSIAARKLDDTIPSFDDHTLVCQTAKGKINTGGSSTRRYVGFRTGKITDYRSDRVTFAEYDQWLSQIVRTLESSKTPTRSFNRFAKFVKTPAQPTPTHILLELQEIENEFSSTANQGTEEGMYLSIEDTSCEVTNGVFKISANEKEYNGNVTFNDKRGRYEITIRDIDSDFQSVVPEFKSGIVSFLNRQQSFRVIPKTTGAFYTGGAFYKPALQFGASFNDSQIGLLSALKPFDCLKTIGREKGLECKKNGKGWDDESLFAIIDSLGKGYGLEAEFGEPDIVICDDLETEAADFILGYTKLKKIILIHCKGNNGAYAGRYSASKLQDVCGQATKNLRYLARFGNEEPPNSKKWASQGWSVSSVNGNVKNRIRKFPASSDRTKAWLTLQGIIRQPDSQLEVWLFLGRLLCKDEFEKQMTKSVPAPEAQQAAYLLFSTMTDAAAVGARLKIFCSP